MDIGVITSVVVAVLVFVMSVNALGLVFRPLQFWGRFFLCFLSMCVCATYGVIASIVLSLLGKRSLSQWTAGRAFYILTSRIIGLRVEMQNEEVLTSTRPGIIIGNHQSEMDVLILGRIFPKFCSVTAKSSLRFVPFLGWFMLISGTVFIDRGNRGKAIKALDGAIRTMRKHGQTVFLFPEGTRSYFSEPDLLPFKRGAFHLAIQSGFPIVPVVVSNYSNIFNFKKRILKSGTITVRVLDPISTTGLGPDDVDKLVASTRTAMLEVLKEISPAPSGPSSTTVPGVPVSEETAQLLSPIAASTDAASTDSLEPRESIASALSANVSDSPAEMASPIELDSRET
ncbi:uncharacterized protein V1518DRAFT_409248 [Limtongia smithiae]|uniref:uncharacterized protein n=1 Tax=Limtongia smithiae TaxID=1125753 RepID=UPI0034CFB42E